MCVSKRDASTKKGDAYCARVETETRPHPGERLALLVAVAHLKHLLISWGCPTKRHAALAETRR